jgi:urease accessory protein
MTETLRAVAYVPPGSGKIAFDICILYHDERRVRRRLLKLQHGDEVLIDFPRTITLEGGSMLELADGRFAEIIAGEEKLYAVYAQDTRPLAELAWHVGNRHAKAQIESDHLLILRDHVLRDMLMGLGATVTEVSEPFHPMDGAYAHAHGSEDHALVYRR